MHKSVLLESSPIEFIEVTPINPLISKCQIKVCYVSDEPNRNRSIITKEVAKKMANSLPGSPIVGFFNEASGDFEEHNRALEIENGKLKFRDTTRPYGFVDLGAKVWFQKFTDDDKDVREYLMTEGFLWTGQYPECERAVTETGNNQSMELDQKTLNAAWSKDNKGNPEFFIINEAIISKLCILGEEFEPCFEGSSITAPKIQFSFEDGFKEQLFSMMKELKDLLNEGGEKVFTRYAVEVGDTLWTALYSHVEENYSIERVYEDDAQKFAVLKSDDKHYRLDFSIAEDGEITFSEIIEFEGYTPDEEPQFAEEDVKNFVENYKKKGNSDEEEEKKPDNSSEESGNEDTCPECGKPKDECECEKDDKKEYVLEEISEYVELLDKYSALQTAFDELNVAKESLETQIGELTQFKNQVERKEKENMIASFYMLSDEDKADVIANVDSYSLDDIEAKLSIICVRNKVSFDLEEEKKDTENHTTFSLDDSSDDDTPAWVKAALAVAKNMN